MSATYIEIHSSDRERWIHRLGLLCFDISETSVVLRFDDYEERISVKEAISIWPWLSKYLKR